MLAPTKTLSGSNQFAEVQRTHKRRSSASSRNSSQNSRGANGDQYVNWIPIYLVFLNKKLDELAKANLSKPIIKVHPDLTVNGFAYEVLHSIKTPPFKPETRVVIGFYGKSAKHPLRVGGGELITRVYEKICSIENQREMACQKSDNLSARYSSGDQQPNLRND